MTRWANENTWDAAIRDAASHFGVPVPLIKAIIAQESGYRPTAFRAEPQLNDGSVGLMQILYKTAQGEGYTGPLGSAPNLSGLYYPATNIYYGTSYLSWCLHRTGGNVASAISCYNGGYRPSLGFGAPPYKNQLYVANVLNYMGYFETQLGATPTVIPVSTPPPLDNAHHDAESQTGGRVSGSVADSVGTHAPPLTHALREIWEWFKSLLKRRR